MRVGRVSSGIPHAICVCDSRIVPEALRLALGDRGEVVADATTGGEAVGLCELFVPDVVVASELLSDGVVENFVPALLRTGSRVLVMCEPRDTAALVELVALGVTGLVLNDGTPQELSEAVLDPVGRAGRYSPPKSRRRWPPTGAETGGSGVVTAAAPS